MKLSLIYHVHSNHKNLKKSLDSIFSQSSKDFEFVLVDDSSTETVKKCIKSYDFSKLRQTKYINTNQKIGHSFSFNAGLDVATGEYVYYLGSSNILNKNFIKKINDLIEKTKNVDFIILSESKKQKSLVELNAVDKNLFSYLKPSIKDKIFNATFLKNNQICFENFQYYPLVYLYKCLNKVKKVVCYSDDLVKFISNATYSYNLYDTFEQADILMKNKDSYSFTKTKENKDIYDFMIVYSICYSFMFKIYKTYWNTTSLTSRKIIRRAIHTANTWLTENLGNWKSNPIIQNNTLNLDKKKSTYLKDFKFKLSYIHKVIS